MTVYQDVDLSMTGQLVPPVVRVKQYDHKARKVRCTLYSNGLAFSPPDGAVLAYSGTRPDGKFFSYSSESSDYIICSDSTVAITVTEYMTNVPGRFPVDVVLMDGDGEILGAFCLTLYVEKSAVRNWKIAAGLYRAIAQAVGRGIYECFTTDTGYFGVRSDDGLDSDGGESSNLLRIRDGLVKATITDTGCLRFTTDDNLFLRFGTDREGRIVAEYGGNTGGTPVN